jgi:hypothetical protein
MIQKRKDSKQQLRVMVSNEAIKRASLIAQKTGLSMSQIVNDSIIRASGHQASIATGKDDFNVVKEDFYNSLKEAKHQIIEKYKDTT